MQRLLMVGLLVSGFVGIQSADKEIDREKIHKYLAQRDCQEKTKAYAMVAGIAAGVTSAAVVAGIPGVIIGAVNTRRVDEAMGFGGMGAVLGTAAGVGSLGALAAQKTEETLAGAIGGCVGMGSLSTIPLAMMSDDPNGKSIDILLASGGVVVVGAIAGAVAVSTRQYVTRSIMEYNCGAPIELSKEDQKEVNAILKVEKILHEKTSSVLFSLLTTGVSVDNSKN